MIIEKLNHDLKEAMKNRNQIRLDTLRMLKSKILNQDARGNLPDPEVIKLFKTYFSNLQEAIELAQAGKRRENVERLIQEQIIVQEYLPKPLTIEETKEFIKQAIQNSGAKTKKDLSLVMRTIKTLNASIDGKLAKQLAEEHLSDEIIGPE